MSDPLVENPVKEPCTNSYGLSIIKLYMNIYNVCIVMHCLNRSILEIPERTYDCHVCIPNRVIVLSPYPHS